MKLAKLALSCLLTLSAPLFAANQHIHPQSSDAKTSIAAPWANDCEIEIINRSFSDLRVFGIFDDGVSLDPFNVYSFDSAHYISLYYNGYCHSGMDLDIDTFSGYHVFGGYVRRGSTVRITPFLTNQVKAEVRAS